MITDSAPRRSKETAANRLLLAFADAIDTGGWKSGERIPTERELSEHYGVARNTIRRALQELEQAGRIVRQVGRGTFVTERAAPRPKDLAHRIQNASPAEIMEVRMIVEPQVAELAAARANGSEIDAIAECLKRGEAAVTVAEFEMWDGLFHQTIVGACRNQLLIDVYDAINAVRRKADWTALKERVLTPARRTLTQKQHRRVLAALRARNARKAADEMRQHLVDVRNSIIRL